MRSLTTRWEQFGILLGEVCRGWKARLNDRLRPLGLSQSKWLALLHLSRCKGGVIQKDLASLIGIEGPTLVRLLDRLEADGWVKRKISKQDRRSKIVHLTKKAQPALIKIHMIATHLRQEILSSIREAELETSLQALEKIKKKVDLL